jgi:hypothetical protein
MHGDLAELLLAHRLGGAWRAPLGTLLRAVPAQQVFGTARIVEAGSADCARAHAALCPVPMASFDLAGALHPFAALLAQARLAEGFDDAARPPLAKAGAGGAVLILGARAASPALVAQALAACALAGRAVLFKPAPRAAVSGAYVLRALGLAGLAGPGVAMVHGGGATGRLLMAHGGWGQVLILGKGHARAGLPALPVPDAAGLMAALAMPAPLGDPLLMTRNSA